MKNKMYCALSNVYSGLNRFPLKPAVFLVLGIMFGSGISIADDRKSVAAIVGSYVGERSANKSDINRDSISTLESLWTFSGGGGVPGDTVQAAPVFTGSKLISVSLSGELRAIDPADGTLIWKTQLLRPLGRRGLSYWAPNDGSEGYIFVASGEFVFQILESDGSIVKKFNTGLSLLAPMIVKNHLLVATLANGVRSFEVQSGTEKWNFSLKKNGVSARVWSGFSYDDVSDSVFVVTSNPGGIVGVGRGIDDYSVSLLAIDGSSGQLNWQFKYIKNDLWDLDLTAPPIIFDIPGDHRRAVVSASKSGELVYLDVATGEPIFPESIIDVSVLPSDVVGVSASPKQLVVVKPEPFSDLEVQFENDFDHLDERNFKYVANKIRHGKSGSYVPPSLNYDVVMLGIHGGADWPGLSYDETTHSVIVPYNRNPFILRLFYQDSNYYYLKKGTIFYDKAKTVLLRKAMDAVFQIKLFLGFDTSEVESEEGSLDVSGLHRWSQDEWVEKGPARLLANNLYAYLPGGFSNKKYTESCSSCHGNARQGDYQTELWGDGFYPPLAGLTLTDKFAAVATANKINLVHQIAGVEVVVTEKEYRAITKDFSEYDLKLLENDRLGLTGFWQMLLDRDGYPANSPPWGGIAKIDLHSGRKLWSIPLGIRPGTSARGDIAFGGVVALDSQIFFASGTPDRMAYGLDSMSGEIIWQSELPFAGSAPPMTFYYRGCIVVAFMSTGGRFVGYDGNGDSLAAYKRSDCHFSNDD